MRPPLRPLLLVPGVALLVGCGTGGVDPAPVASSSVATPAAERTGTDLGVDAFGERVAETGTVVLDVRSPAEFAGGHLPGAVNLDLRSADFRDRLGDLDQDARYAVYCQSGNRSAQALATMLDLGFTDVAHLEGGIGAWEAADLPVVTG